MTALGFHFAALGRLTARQGSASQGFDGFRERGNVCLGSGRPEPSPASRWRFARHGLGAALRGCRVNRRRGAIACAALVMMGVSVVSAEEGQTIDATGQRAFHIPAQPLANALQAYGQRTGIQVLYESNSALGRRSTTVDGVFTPDAALTLLLTGSDLKVRYLRPDAITLALPSADADVPPPTPLGPADLSLGTLRVRGSSSNDDTSRLSDYSESVRADIQDALRKNARTRGGNYRAVLDLWIASSRAIERTELFRSTGDQERDADVAAALRGLTISRPAPANTPQPVRVVIVVKSLQ